MYRVALILKAVHSYNGDCMIENPLNSTFWKQDFISEVQGRPARRARVEVLHD